MLLDPARGQFCARKSKVGNHDKLQQKYKQTRVRRRLKEPIRDVLDLLTCSLPVHNSSCRLSKANVVSCAGGAFEILGTVIRVASFQSASIASRCECLCSDALMMDGCCSRSAA